MYLCKERVCGELHHAICWNPLLPKGLQTDHDQGLVPSHSCDVYTLHDHHLVLLERILLFLGLEVVSWADEFRRLCGCDDLESIVVDVRLVLLVIPDPHGGIEWEDKLLSVSVADGDDASILQKVDVIHFSGHYLRTLAVETLLHAHPQREKFSELTHQLGGSHGVLFVSLQHLQQLFRVLRLHVDVCSQLILSEHRAGADAGGELRPLGVTGVWGLWWLWLLLRLPGGGGEWGEEGGRWEGGGRGEGGGRSPTRKPIYVGSGGVWDGGWGRVRGSN